MTLQEAGAGEAEHFSGEQLALIPEGNLAEELDFAEDPVVIVEPDGLGAMGEAASARGYLWIGLTSPGPAYRGRLGLYIEEAIESQLEERGALPPGIQASSGLDASLSDQLYRARLLEMRGLALGIPSLSGIANLGRALDAEDSAVLRWWMAATSDRPVRLIVSADNTKLRVYPSPVVFETLFDVAPASMTPRPPNEAMAQSSEAMDLSDLPPEVSEEDHTNLLGTKVQAYESPLSSDVDLPDLDAALGLSSNEPSPPAEQLPLYQAEEDEVSGVQARASEAPASELPEAPPSVGVICVEPNQMRVERHRCEAGDFEEPGPEDEQETSLDPLISEVTETSRAPRVDVQAQEGQDAKTLAEAISSEHEGTTEYDVAPAQTGGEELGDDDSSGLGDLDEEEFLRTLAEDSSRAPEVRPVRDAESSLSALGSGGKRETPIVDQEPDVSSDSPDGVTGTTGFSPLPTKKIARNPFIRLANDNELAVQAPGQSEESASVSAAEEASRNATTEPPPPDPADPFNQLAAKQWQSWVKNLEAARGPKPLSVIERMFVTDYTRLREAVRRGVADKSAQAVVDEWQQSFTVSYREAFDALRVRGKRPTMVLDLPELAARLGRLQGAQRVQLLLVDGMRFDLGLMIQERMRARAEAALTERLLLWSALPTTTSYQLELLGKGPDGLKELPTADESPALVARGRAALTPRRVRTGSLELLKLDVVEDMLRQPGAPIEARLDDIADAASEAILQHFTKLPPRSMVVVFGDHGFALDPNAVGTTEEVQQGGASPEEVLVPAFAWLTGAVH